MLSLFGDEDAEGAAADVAAPALVEPLGAVGVADAEVSLMVRTVVAVGATLLVPIA